MEFFCWGFCLNTHWRCHPGHRIGEPEPVFGEWLAKKSMILLLNSLSKTLFLDLLGIPS